ncbi:MAG: T9SS type A sorting domain-containing protein, partial [Deltaproteobacteria bacterium]|nr:T9SS type A sorting domain-containing protein [Deltaproteobacteria bacterium]
GETLWEAKSIPVQAGYNKLEWVYRKDMSIAGGGDYAMIDMIDFTQKGSVRYIQKDLVTGMIISPVQQENLGREPVTVKMLNLGPDTINGFNMAFRINDGIAVYQHFSDILYPSLDSVEITFNSRANVSHFGVYDLVVYSYDNNDENLFNDTLRVQIENNELDEPLLVFPNPFVDELKIVISSEAEGMARFILFNSAGKKIIDFEQPVYEGINEAIIRDNRLITSIYYLKVSFPGFSKTIPVIKIR